jgi:hypothetical protein
MNFKQCFFRIYDKKIASGEITFSRTGISKDQFTALCTEPDFVFDGALLDKLKETMNLTDEQHDMLVRAAAGEDV